jgi:hypothetical protein
LDIAVHDAFRYGGGLNKTAALVYWSLLNAPKNVSDLVSSTGRSRRTVFRVLARMANIVDYSTGEIVAMVEKIDGLWYAISVDLDSIAILCGTSGKGNDEKKKHKEERLRHQDSLKKGLNKLLHSNNQT